VCVLSIFWNYIHTYLSICDPVPLGAGAHTRRSAANIHTHTHDIIQIYHHTYPYTYIFDIFVLYPCRSFNAGGCRGAHAKCCGKHAHTPMTQYKNIFTQIHTHIYLIYLYYIYVLVQVGTGARARSAAASIHTHTHA